MAHAPHPTLAERLFEKCTVIRCTRSKRGIVCPACAALKKPGAPLCDPCLLELLPDLRAELESSEIRLGYERVLYRALLERKAKDFCEASVGEEGVLPVWPRKKGKEQSDG